VWQHRRLLVPGAFLVVVMRVGLWVAPLAALQVLVSRWGRGRYSAPVGPRREDPAQQGAQPSQVLAQEQVLEARQWREVRDMSWAVMRAARLVPQATCLTQALAMQVLLGRRGYSSRLCLGVAKRASAKFEAHAWIECAGRVVIGGESGENWTPLTSWNFEPLRSLAQSTDGDGRLENA
jgi:hypothetical protein